MKFKSGNIIKVCDSGMCCPSYKRLVQKLLPDDIYLFKPGECPPMDKEMIIVAGDDQGLDGVYYIITDILDTQVYVILEEGLELYKPIENMEIFDKSKLSILNKNEKTDNIDNIENLQLLLNAIDNHEFPKNVSDHLDICCQINELYESKNADYGNTIEKGINDLGWCYLYSQLYNKLQRFINLTSSDKEINNESLEDTLLDLANYAIEGVRVMRSNKESEEK